MGERREGDDGRQPPGQLCSALICSPEGAKAGGICSPQDRAGARSVQSLRRGFQPSGSHISVLSEAARASRLCQPHQVPPGCQHLSPLSTHIGAGLRAVFQGADPDSHFFLFTGTWLTALVMVSQKPLTQSTSLCQYYIVLHSHRSVP